jgi:hypothetical protein
MAEALEKLENDEYSALGADLEAAWDDSASEEVEEVSAEVEEVEAVEEVEEVEEVEAAETEEAPEAVDETPPDDSEKPPAGLSPEGREAWKDTPPAMQKAIAQREREFSMGIRQNAEGAKRAESMTRSLEPYQQYLAMNGGPSHIGTLLQTGAGLQMGSPIQKAQTVANIIKQYGIDINTLDSMLVGEAPPPQAQPQPQNSPEMQEIRQFMDYQRNQAQQQGQQEQQNVATDIAGFAADPKHEFYNDVAPVMAQLFDIATQNGQKIDLHQAYDKACRMDDRISTILSSRRSAGEIAVKSKAATSIIGSPGGPGGIGSGNTLNSDLRDAWDSAGRT